ncbi:triadin [Diceros bicornis minor]|uniref:triadin n=1 Tax=Diceros bicornis minor TaxID=77932 RepID=UPI0026F1D5BE|nr:triadin [Diceros bicornis minor]
MMCSKDEGKASGWTEVGVTCSHWSFKNGNEVIQFILQKDHASCCSVDTLWGQEQSGRSAKLPYVSENAAKMLAAEMSLAKMLIGKSTWNCGEQSENMLKLFLLGMVSTIDGQRLVKSWNTWDITLWSVLSEFLKKLEKNKISKNVQVELLEAKSGAKCAVKEDGGGTWALRTEKQDYAVTWGSLRDKEMRLKEEKKRKKLVQSETAYGAEPGWGRRLSDFTELTLTEDNGLNDDVWLMSYHFEGNASTTTTVIDSKNGSVPKSPGKVVKRTVTEDIVTTFSSPAAWLLVIALIITWSAVAIVMFDLVDYRNLSASSISKIGSDPLKLVHDAVEETTDWVYGFFSLLSDIISSDGDEEDDDGDEDTDKGEIEEPPLKKKEIHKDKIEKQEKPERKIQTKVTHREKEKVKDKEKPEKKATHKEKIERKEKPETKTVTKEEKKAKTKEKTEEKTKKEVKGGKQEKVKPTAAKVKEVQKTSAKPKEKDRKETAAVSKHEQKDQYAFCRYMIDIFVHGDLKPGQSPAIPPPLPTEQASRPTLASPTLEDSILVTVSFQKDVELRILEIKPENVGANGQGYAL